MAGSLRGTAEAQPEREGTSRLFFQPQWARQRPACCLSLHPGQLQLQGILCCSPALSSAVQFVLLTPHSAGVPAEQPQHWHTGCPRAPGQLYLADHLQHVPGGVPRPDDCQGRLVVGQAEPRGREVLVHPNITVGVVLVDAAQGHFLLPLKRQKSIRTIPAQHSPLSTNNQCIMCCIRALGKRRYFAPKPRVKACLDRNQQLSLCHPHSCSVLLLGFHPMATGNARNATQKQQAGKQI